MSANEHERFRIEDDVLEDVTGGSMMIRNANYNKQENAGTHAAILDESNNGKVSQLGRAIKSGDQNTVNINIREGKGIAGKNMPLGGNIEIC